MIGYEINEHTHLELAPYPATNGGGRLGLELGLGG